MKLFIVTFALVISALVRIFYFTPVEINQGIVQKIFYVHVGAAMAMYTGCFLSFLFSILYLNKKKLAHFQISQSSLEVGYIFCCIVLLVGPIWAKPIWGTYWTWEPRLTTTFIAWLMYSGYLLLYYYFRETRKIPFGVLSALSIISFFNIPMIHLSVRLWRGVHPSVIKNKDGLPPSMQITLLLTMVAMVSLYFLIFRQRLAIHRLETKIQQYKEGN